MIGYFAVGYYLLGAVTAVLIAATIYLLRITAQERAREQAYADAHVAKYRAQQDQDSSRRGTFDPTRSA